MKIVFFTGSGISQESGIPTFRDRFGIWENFDPLQLASTRAWRFNKKEVLFFHNQLRKMVVDAKPNAAHHYIAKLEKKHETIVITQNVDALHQRAGSSNILQLHGNILEVRSENNANIIQSWMRDLTEGDLAPDGSQLRPNVVWFGEQLDSFVWNKALRHIAECDVLVVMGTSLSVFPACELVKKTSENCKIIVVDPNPNQTILSDKKIKVISKTAVDSLDELDFNLNYGHIY
jgi:NAD-dependent deacetylase